MTCCLGSLWLSQVRCGSIHWLDGDADCFGCLQVIVQFHNPW